MDEEHGTSTPHLASVTDMACATVSHCCRVMDPWGSPCGRHTPRLPAAPLPCNEGIADRDLHKLIVRQWQEPRAVLMYILQGRFVAPLAAAEATHMLRRVVDSTSRVVKMLTTLSKIAIEAFGPPVADGSVAVPRQAEVHFHAFTMAWATLLVAGGEDGGALSQARRLIITTELQEMAADLSSYMREHYNTLIRKEAAVRRRIIHVPLTGICSSLSEK